MNAVTSFESELDDWFGDGVNDARVSGTISPEWLALLDRPMTFLLPSDLKRDAQQAKWNNSTAPLRAWIEGGDSSGFSHHVIKSKKGYFPIVFGASVSDARKALSMVTVDAMALDVDSGNSFSDALDRCEELGLAVIGYTSFNDGTTVSTAPRDAVRKALGHTNDVTNEELRGYLTATGKYTAEHVASVAITDQARHEEGGLQIAYSHAPLEKFRLVFPLASPVEVAKLASTQRASFEVFASKVRGLGELIGLIFDQSCTDASRAFYMPAHRKGAEFALDIVRGRGLTFEELPEVGKTGAKNAFEIAGGNSGPAVETSSGLNLKRWAATHGKRLEIARLIEFEAPDKVRESKGGLLVIECPFDETHSNAGDSEDSACHVRDADGDVGFAWKCKHDSCAGHDRLDMLAKALADGWFEESKLTDEDYLVPLPEEEEDEVIEEIGSKTHEDRAADFTKESSQEDIDKFIKKLVKLDVDLTVKANVLTIIAGNTNLGKRELNAIWRGFVSEKKRKDSERKKSGGGGGIRAIVNEWDFKQVCEYTQCCVHDMNRETPTIFHYVEGLVDVRADKDGRMGFNPLSKDDFAHHVNKVADFARTSGDGDKSQGVSCPYDVVNHLYSADYSAYPSVAGMVSTPVFTKNGTLLSQRGYDPESKLYFEPGNFVMRRVSANPSEEEVAEALSLLVEDVLGDFSLDGWKRAELMEKLAEGAPLPSVAHALSFMLLPFMRSMIVGPTPAHAFNKAAPGSGASLLVDSLSTIVTGTPAAAQELPESKEEMNKHLLSVLLKGRSIVYFDNINHKVDSGVFASALTAPTFEGRILGQNNTAEVDIMVTWAMAANNLRLSPELARRVVLILLDPKTASPDMRDPGMFLHNLKQWVPANRTNLVWACHTLIQNWIAGGMVQQKDEVLASFEDWSGIMGGVIKAAGVNGFLTNRSAAKGLAPADDDPEHELGVRMAEYPEGTHFVTGAVAPGRHPAGTVSVRALLENFYEDETDISDKVLKLPHWGYRDDAYGDTRRIGKAFKTFAERRHAVGPDTDLVLTHSIHLSTKTAIWTSSIEAVGETLKEGA